MTQPYGSDPFAYSLSTEPRAGREETYLEIFQRGGFAKQTTYGYGFPTKSKLEGLAMHVDKATAAELRTHATKFGSQGIGQLMPTRPATEDLAAKSQAVELQELSRKRSKRRRNLDQEARALLDRRPGLMPLAVADALNISDRRAKNLLERLAVEAA